MIAYYVRGAAQSALLAFLAVMGAMHAEAQSGTELTTLHAQVMRLYYEGNRNSELLPLAERHVTLTRQKYGEEGDEYVGAVWLLAVTYEALGRYTAAEALYRRCLTINQKIHGPEHPSVARSLNNLAVLYNKLGRSTDAETLQKRSVELVERALPADHLAVAASLTTLAQIYRQQGRLAEAEPLLKRALEIRLKAPASQHPAVGLSLGSLGTLYLAQGRLAQAEPLLKKALEIQSKEWPADSPFVATNLIYLGKLYQAQGRLIEAERLFQRALEMRAAEVSASGDTLGDYDFAMGLCTLALNNEMQGRYTEAESLYERGLAASEKALPESHPFIIETLGHISELELVPRPIDSLTSIRRVAAILNKSTRDAVSTKTICGREEFLPNSWYFQLHVRAAWRVAGEDPRQSAALRAESFRTAQFAIETETARALSQMAVRFGAGDTKLASLVRERQDLQAQWKALDKELSAVLSFSVERRGGADERARKQMSEIEARIDEIDMRFKVEFPNFSALARPEPLSIEDAAQLLHPDEALVLFLAGDTDETFAWALTREGVTWQRIPLGAKVLADKVKALREGLEIQDEKQATKTRTLFDLDLARDLYATLLGPIATFIQEKRHLLVVPSGVLTGLPFHLLVTEPPASPNSNGDQLHSYRDAAWLIRRHAVTVLPSVSSLHALRVLAKGGRATKPMIGFGDPVFGQRQVSAEAGRATQMAIRSASKTRSYGVYWHGTHADLDALRTGLAPLPETASELKAVAQGLGAAQSDLKLGSEANEATVKRSDLSPYRVVYFATHALVGGEIASLAEPALALTIPAEPTELDDGLLTGSEVAQLKLNADWVVLSACNTAAGDKPGAEALSGLARAFFYAGARALLVSHWEVDSAAAVRLTTTTFEALQKDPTMGRAQALRRSMLAMIGDTSDPWNAYPYYWAPFSVVGEGVK
jgi:CHAT domain-containing protein